ncbi:hypothetical protein MmiHf6_17200 [Methanimicrococcus hongohii]|uniref:Uncharacterized protein n=1 Tax=Methanimicrococcus hongohii TaxID=3028295 RepID=A0AA96V120_9EURY|nr:hypothetical protein [Methanimicrococcus sp. Hf6]WNY24389.1 hypothetical protein MmiHf6_17200 [Methanimicrococcus sp. Hf6]
MSKKSLLITVVLIFAFVATAMAIENKSAGENFTSSEYLNTKSIEPVSVASYAADTGVEGENLELNLRQDPDRWAGMFSALQPYSGNET